MTSVASGQSPHQVYETLLNRDPNAPDSEEDWAFLDASSASNPGSISFLPSPGTGSLASYGVIGFQGGARMQPSPPPAPSPLYLDLDAGLTFPTEFSPDQVSSLSMNVTSADISHLMASPGVQTPSDLGAVPMMAMPDFSQFQPQVDLTGLTPFGSTSFPTSDVSAASLQSFFDVSAGQPPIDLSTLPLQSELNSAPWNAAALTTLKDSDPIFVMDNFRSTPSPLQTSASVSPLASSPHSPSFFKHESSPSRSLDKSTPSPIRKTHGDSRVKKKKHTSPDAPSALATNMANQFVVMTADTMANKGMECFEAMGRATQKGRKGPLSSQTKEDALQVRRTGACFCCRARKVKCDAQRPCTNCKKIKLQVPQVVCWQFPEFIPVLFPTFFREHLQRSEVSRFVTESADFSVDGAEMPVVVMLSSGWRWKSALTVKAKFFTPISEEVKRHWHMKSGGDQVSLEYKDSVHVGLDFDSGPQREELKKKIKEYMAAILQEPALVEQLTETLTHTTLPYKILHIARRFADLSQSPMVKKALNIYALQYVMTRHLCLNPQTLRNLQQLGHVSPHASFITPRLLNRQLKAIIDEILIREMTTLFDAFVKSLKPKSRKEWGPCTAAFLVLCNFMEAVETTADQFTISTREANASQGQKPAFGRHEAIQVNKEIENMPFKQFAYQFHQIYQTHVKDAGAKAFNPLRDPSLLFTPGELDPAATQLTLDLRQLMEDRETWDEIDLLTMDPILGNEEFHPFPRDVAFNYTGRLTAKFLMSFYDESRIFG